MSYHVIDISTEGAVLSVKNRQLVCRLPDGTANTLPLEDVGAVIVNAFSILLHNSFLSAAADEKVAVVICERFRPKSILLPATRGADTLLTRAQITASTRFLDTLWYKTIDAKTSNQCHMAKWMVPNHPDVVDLENLCHRSDTQKEGMCARLYWEVFGTAVGSDSFRRLQDGDGLNSLLNYGYGVLLCRVLQKLFAFGLDPMYGVGHVVRERAAPLAYDIMEPFRIVVDRAVLQWIRENGPVSETLAVNKAFKTAIHGIMKTRYPYRNVKSLPVEDILDCVLKGLRSAFLSGKTTEYKPWTWRNSEWAG